MRILVWTWSIQCVIPRCDLIFKHKSLFWLIFGPFRTRIYAKFESLNGQLLCLFLAWRLWICWEDNLGSFRATWPLPCCGYTNFIMYRIVPNDRRCPCFAYVLEITRLNSLSCRYCFLRHLQKVRVVLDFLVKHFSLTVCFWLARIFPLWFLNCQSLSFAYGFLSIDCLKSATFLINFRKWFHSLGQKRVSKCLRTF